MRKMYIFLKSVLFSTLIVVCLCGCGKDTAYYMEGEEAIMQSTEQEPGGGSEEDENEEEAYIYVYVCGQIQTPGVYSIPEGSRVCDLFAIAGGFTKDAAADYWNQARLLKDGEMIYVPSKEEAKNHTHDGETSNKIENDKSNKVNINTASKEELLDAKKNPEKYPNLIVRVTGFSDYFVKLHESIQDDIIARTEHKK